MIFIEDVTRPYPYHAVDINDYAAHVYIGEEQMVQPDYVNDYIGHMENKAIIEAVRQAGRSIGEWLMIRFETHKLQSTNGWQLGGIEYATKIFCRSVKTEQHNVVYRIADSLDALPETHNKFCKFCGGYTTNDMRGQCAACGGPRGWK